MTHAPYPMRRTSAATVRRASGVAAAALCATLLAACSSGHPDATSSPSLASGAATVSGSATIAASPSPSASASAVLPTTQAAPGSPPMQVRDAFAVLQATYNDSCGTPGNCEYFLNRLLTNLDDLDNAMKASPEGTAHFRQPLTWIAQLQSALGGDFSFENLKRHEQLLIQTRGKINTWMQAYPQDYR